jgi:hypothetical protein
VAVGAAVDRAAQRSIRVQVVEDEVEGVTEEEADDGGEDCHSPITLGEEPNR